MKAQCARKPSSVTTQLFTSTRQLLRSSAIENKATRIGVVNVSIELDSQCFYADCWTHKQLQLERDWLYQHRFLDCSILLRKHA